MKTSVLVAMMLAAVTTAPALAQTSYRAANDGGPMIGAAVASNSTMRGPHAAYAAASSAYAAGPAVYSYDRYAGWDPDPSIRLMLKRDENGTDAQ